MEVVAILMPGDMGHAVGRELRAHGHDVITCLAGRSERTRRLAAAAGLRDLPDLDAVVAEADLVLSILPPARALDQARAVAEAMRRVGRFPVYVDCNAVSPDTAGQIASAIGAAGAPFVDCGIIGLAPGKDTATRFYVSGADTRPMEALDGKGIRVIACGGEVGRASALKMCYAALTKGSWTLQTALLLAAARLDVLDELLEEFAFSQQAALTAMEQRIPRLPADSERWIGEMEEIAATFESVGVPRGFHDGAAAIFRLLARTPFASETREDMDTSRSLTQAIHAYAEQLARDRGEKA
ncbi:MAG: NAD(P)-dependent oxidoreductase [Methyloligellaceae bacterium]